MADQETVTLISKDGFQFIVRKKAASDASRTIRDMLSTNSGARFMEATENKITFEDMSGLILEKVCEYFYYRERYKDTDGPIPEFAIPPEMALELLTVADFLYT